MKLCELNIGDRFILLRSKEEWKLVHSEFLQPIGTLFLCINAESGKEAYLHGQCRVERVVLRAPRNVKRI